MDLNNSCFIISPIGQRESESRLEADNVLDFIITPALQSFSLPAVRSDQLSIPGTITEQMFRYILQSKLCIVLLTGENPNVFYELAVAQCAGRPTLLLIRENSRLPFDIKDLRVIKYDLSNPRRHNEDIEELKKHITSIKDNNWETTSLFKQYPFGPKLYTDKELMQKIESIRPQPLNYGIDKSYSITDNPLRRLKIITGSIENVSNVDIVVNSENIDLQIARFYDPSLSGVLRYLDAERSVGGNIIRDNLNEKIQEIIKTIGTMPVQPGTVVVTETNGLAQQGIKYVFHLALARGEIGSGYYNVADRLEAGLRNVFRELNNTHAKNNTVASILFPLLGAGTTKTNPVPAAQEMIKLMMVEIKKTSFNLDVYLLAWRESHRVAFQKATSELNLKEIV